MRDHLILVLDGDKPRNEGSIPLVADEVKGKPGRFWYHQPGNKGFGVQIEAVNEALPTSVDLFDPTTDETVTIYLSKGETEDGRAKVSGSQSIDLRGEVKSARVSISVTKAGDWNVIGKVFGQGGGGGGNVRSTTSLWDL